MATNNDRLRALLALLVGLALLLALSSGRAEAASNVLVTDVSPDGDATGVAADSNVTAKFNRIMKASTINNSTFYLKREGSLSAIPAAVSYSRTSKTAKLNPEGDLEAGATYTAAVKGGKRGVRASDGGKLGGTRDGTATFASGKVTWTFTVANDAPPSDTEPPSLVNYDPTPGARNVPVDVSPKATVNESLRPNSVNTQGITMYEDFNQSQLVDIAVGYDENTKTISVDPVADLKEGTVYAVKVSGIADLAGNVQDGYQAWTFGTGDATAPTVSSVAPTRGATGVATNTKVEAAFSEAMDASSITDQSFTLSKDGSPVAADVSYDRVSKKATLQPNSNLKASTVYEATITTSVKDSAGNAMAESYAWSFTTAPDTLPPTVSSVSPANGTTKVSINTNVTATFSEEMDPSTLTNQSFSLSRSGTPIPAQVTYDTNGSTATLDPNQNLENSTTYQATITTSAKDSAGNAVTEQKSWSFTTADPGVTFTPNPLSFTSDALCFPESKLLTVNNGGPGDVTFAQVSITGADAARFSTGAQRYLASNGSFTVLAGKFFQDEVTFVPTGGRPQPRTYSATLTYKDGTGATIGSPVTLSATTNCLVFG